MRAPTSAVGGRFEPGVRSISFSSGTVDEPRGSQLYQHDPALRHQLRSSRKRREKQRTRNNRRRRRSALEGSGRAGHHAGGTRANPGAFWNRPERNRTIEKCEQKHRGSTVGHENTDTENKQPQLKLGERRNGAKRRHRSSLNGANESKKRGRFEFYFLFVQLLNTRSVPDPAAAIRSRFCNAAEPVERERFGQFYFRRRMERIPEDGAGPGPWSRARRPALTPRRGVLDQIFNDTHSCEIRRKHAEDG